MVGLLAGALFVELLLNRVLARLLRPEPLAPRTALVRAIDLAGLYVFELTGVLALLLLAAQIGRVLFVGGRYRVGARVSFALVGGVCLALCALGLLFRLTPDLDFHLQLSFGFFALLIVVAAVGAPVPGRVKLGTLALWVPLGLHTLSVLSQRLALLGTSPMVAARYQAAAQVALVIAGLASAPLLSPLRRVDRQALFGAALVGVGATVLTIFDWDSAARVSRAAFGVELPLVPYLWLLYLLAMATAWYTALSLLKAGGPARLRGIGLVLLLLIGLQIELPYQVACAALALLCLAEAAVRTPSPAQPRADFEAQVRGAAAALGAPQVTLTGPEGYEVARLHPAGGAAPVEITIARRRGVVAEVEVTIGEAPPRDPPFTAWRRSAARLGPKAEGPCIATTDDVFDREFQVHDRRGLSGPLLDEATRGRMAELVHGWLGLWPQRGVRYRADSLPSDDGLASLVRLLVELSTRAA
jgi:hypothetical protein